MDGDTDNVQKLAPVHDFKISMLSRAWAKSPILWGCGGSLRGCGGSLVSHQTVTLQSQVRIRHPSTCRNMSAPSWGAKGVVMATAGWPLRGGRGTKNEKIQTKKTQKN